MNNTPDQQPSQAPEAKAKETGHFYGMMPILATPVDSRLNLEEEDLRREVDYCLKAGCKAVGTLGGASEYLYIGRKMRTQIIRTVVSAVNGRVPVFIGTAANSLADTIENSIEAQDLGADLLLLCSPPVGNANADEIYAYYETVAANVSIPIIVQDTGASWPVYAPDFLVRLYEGIENVRYVKAEGGNWLNKLHDLMKIVPDGLQVIGGAAGMKMLQMLRLGITAFMTGTEAQEIHNAVVQAYLSGDEDRAVHLYCTTLSPYLELYTTSNHTSLKHMLVRRGIFKSDTLIFPGMEHHLQSDFALSELDWILDRIDRQRI